MTTTLYTKQGRRYLPWGTAEHWTTDADVMRVGTFRLTSCPAGGHYRHRYDVTPETAGFAAAAEIARQAMEDAIKARAVATPSGSLAPYTKRQREIIERFRAEMAAAGGLLPTHWQQADAREIAEAGIQAVRDWAGGKTK